VSLHGVNARFVELVEADGLPGKRVLDVGCGWGRVSLLLAPAAARVIGLERDAALVAEARRRAAVAGLTNVEFHEVDVDRDEYQRFAPDIVVSHLFASDAMVERAARALPPGGGLAIVAFHVDQWKETGRVSRFAYDEARMRALLDRAGFAPEAVEVDREERRFASVEEGLAAAVGLEDRWKADGRWFRYIAFLEAGGRTLTRSHLVVKARRR
jgi:protein-L-isoaspartate O-methyltransferase